MPVPAVNVTLREVETLISLNTVSEVPADRVAASLTSGLDVLIRAAVSVVFPSRATVVREFDELSKAVVVGTVTSVTLWLAAVAPTSTLPN